jgi:hypothetical protein
LRGPIQLKRSPWLLFALTLLLACGAQDASVKDGAEHPDGVTFELCGNGELDEGEGDIDCGGVCAPCEDGQSCALDAQCASENCDPLGVCLHPSCSNRKQDATEDGEDCGGVCLACLGAACTEDRGCKSTYCEDGVCLKPACDDGVQNGDESGVDCGGSCPQCGEGQRCGTDADCLSYYCREGRCDQPSCTDGVANGFESDVDCGGDCKGCPLGARCDVPWDCTDGNCIDGVCVSMPETCTDGEWNGDETDLDCGGSCWPCAFGGHCEHHADCVTEACEQGLCAAPESCRDGVKSGYETDVDCGGEYCNACALEKYCLVHADCLSLTCLYGICAVPACDDLILNGLESDVDCGGNCAPCGDGDACNEWEDCASFRCVEGVCVSCVDGEANGEETDRDCGGPCEPCGDGLICAVNEDCASTRCADEVCVSCADGEPNGGESDVDCGGPCAGCEDGRSCAEDGDCQSGHCEEAVCVSCADGEPNGGESDVDCGGPCAPCADGLACVVDADCASARCEDGTCTGCGDGLKNGDETDVDCGGSCDPCGGGMACLVDADCTTAVCLPVLTCCDPNACGACGDVPLEICDGVDNDCDSQVDEAADIAPPTPCPLHDGVCDGVMTACHGVDGWGCRPEDYLAHDPAWEAEEEVCDLLDNDCDGLTDEPDFCAVCAEAATPQALFQPASGEAWRVSYQFLALLGLGPAVVMARDAGAAPAEALLAVDGGLEIIEGAANGPPTITALGDDLHMGMLATPSPPIRSWAYTRHVNGSVSASEVRSAKRTDLGVVPIAVSYEARSVLFAFTNGNTYSAFRADEDVEWDATYFNGDPPDPAGRLALQVMGDVINTHAVYRDYGTGGPLKYTRFIGMLPETLAEQAGPPDMAQSGDGLRLVYEDASGDVVHRAWAGAWSGANVVGEGRSPAVTVLSDGSSVVARVTDDDQIKLSIQDGPFAWEPLLTITPDVGTEQSITRVNLEAHESDIVHVAWVRSAADGSNLVIEHQVHCPGIPAP